MNRINYYNRRFSTISNLWNHYESGSIRKHFIDYFVKDHTHSFVPSSSVVSYFDSSVPFVNAGICQFKDVILGEGETTIQSAANSQKCIRVGGKHNDLNVVGIDSYHHTFFEMLGNWSFGKYFKYESCKLAWDLLTMPPYSISPNRLFVTYFSGDVERSLPPDLETKDLWLQIGIHPDRILPFGYNENFWEMGIAGPCGPCTEIHVACTDDLNSATHLVNTGNPYLLELWNIVFITYNRTCTGELIPLKQMFVDTGMGFERLVAVLQRKPSNYDTDLFVPLFNIISQITYVPEYSGGFGRHDTLDCAYRLVADYSRMITVALADNALPDTNPKLRRILRRALLTIQKQFKLEQSNYLLCELSNYIGEKFVEVYPEISDKLNQIHNVITHEHRLLREIQRKDRGLWSSKHPELAEYAIEEYPGLCGAYEFLDSLKQQQPNMINLKASMVHKLFDTYGMETNIICHLARLFGFSIDWDDTNSYMKQVKERSKQRTDILDSFSDFNKLIPKTIDSYKYEYNRIECDEKIDYEFSNLSTKIQAILKGKKIVSLYCADNVQNDDGLKCKLVSIDKDEEIGILTEITNFYYEAGGQIYDVGKLKIFTEEGERFLNVNRVENFSGYIVHYAKISNEDKSYDKIVLKGGDNVVMILDKDHRLGAMQNHTATHLALSALENMLTVTHMKKSKVFADHLTINFCNFTDPFDESSVEIMEKTVRDFISAGFVVHRSTISKMDLIKDRSISLVSGEVYTSKQIHVLSIQDELGKSISKSACCGTHVGNTKDIEDFCITSYKSTGSSSQFFRAITGKKARDTRIKSEELCFHVNSFVQELESIISRVGVSIEELKALRREEQGWYSTVKQRVCPDIDALTYIARVKVNHAFDNLGLRVKTAIITRIRQELIEQINSLSIDENGELKKFIIHVLDVRPDWQEYVTLKKFAEQCTPRPAIIFQYRDNKIHGYCSVPEHAVSKDFNATSWMNPALELIGSRGHVYSNQNPLMACTMTPVEISEECFPDVVETLIKTLTLVANDYFNNNRLEICS